MFPTSDWIGEGIADAKFQTPSYRVNVSNTPAQIADVPNWVVSNPFVSGQCFQRTPFWSLVYQGFGEPIRVTYALWWQNSRLLATFWPFWGLVDQPQTIIWRWRTRFPRNLHVILAYPTGDNRCPLYWTLSRDQRHFLSLRLRITRIYK